MSFVNRFRSAARLLLLPLLLLACSLSATAQNTVKGVLYDDASGEAIPFANVLIEGTKHAAQTDINGFFLINKIPDGSYTLVVKYVGYENYTQPLDLANHKTMTLNIKLKETAQMLKDVVITGNRMEERKVETQVSVEKITATQIQQMPSIGGQADIAQYMQVLPGVNSTGDQGGQLYIRGGSMIQNLCLIDGMIVYNPFHSIGLYSIFETDIILNADIYTGGFGAEYGGRLSSVMDITTRDGNKKRHSGQVGLNTFGANLILEGPLKREKAESKSTLTYLLAAKGSYLSKTSQWIYPYVKGGLPFDFIDAYGKLSLNSGNGSKWNLFGFRYDDRVNNYQSIADYHWVNWGAGTNFVAVTGTSALLDGTVAYSNYKITLDDSPSDGAEADKFSSVSGFNASLNVTNFLGKHRLKAGLSMEGYATKYQFTNQYGNSVEQSTYTTNISAYATMKLNFSDRVLLDPGVRYIFYTSLKEHSLEPRLAAKINATDHLRFKFAGGRYSQILLDARSDNDIVNLFSGFLTATGDLNRAKFLGNQVKSCKQNAWHLVVGAEYDLNRHLAFNLEGYLKAFTQLLNMNHNKIYSGDPAYSSSGAYPKPDYLSTDFVYEKGMAYGMDFSVRYEIERLYVWGTYSLGWVNRTNDADGTYSPHYDRRHTINILATYALGSQRQWELSARWNFGSGFPFTQTQGAYENILFNQDGIATDYTTANGDFGVHYAEIYQGRLPAYHRLDLGVKRKFSLGKRCILTLNASVTNVYSRQNIFYFNRVTFERVNQLPIMGCFGINFSY